VIELTQASVVFNPGDARERRVLSDVSLTLAPGEFVTMIGSNGAGKSTLLNVLSGEVRLAAGTVSFDRTDVTAWPVHRRAAFVGRVFQDPLIGTCGALTIEDNLALAAQRGRTRGLALASGQALRARLRERLATLRLGLEDRLDERMDRLSGGQRQTVSLVMASLVEMKLLLLDEHTAALDPRNAAFVMALTDRIVEEGKLTTLMVTHSMRQALDHGSRTVMMHDGRIVLDLKGDDRRRMSVEDLLHMFSKVRGEAVDDDALLLS
jgi:putative tryptophan/tyrosine transport system ATP-binding protein